LRAAADRPAAPFVRAALRAAAERSTAVGRVAERVAGRDDEAGRDAFVAARAPVRDAVGRRRPVVVRLDGPAARALDDGLLPVRAFALARVGGRSTRARLDLDEPVPAARFDERGAARGTLRVSSRARSAACVVGLPARFAALRLFTTVVRLSAM
jgi:hypothetical protein